MDKSLAVLSDVTVFQKYARYITELNRRETWDEILERWTKMIVTQYPSLQEKIESVVSNFVKPKKVLMSMRSLQFAGRPIEKNPVRSYNCSFVPVNSMEVFHETCFLLLSGTGVGYSVQNHHVAQLPPVVGPRNQVRYLIQDSIEGWSDAVKALTEAYFLGRPRPIFDYTEIRPAGARLKTSGGRAPGPKPLCKALVAIERIFKKATGRWLRPIEAHDILCHIAVCVLSGGIRRSAMIACFSPEDEAMAACKSGEWWIKNSQRGKANNSMVFIRSEISREQFDAFWATVQANKCGEPGIILSNSRESLYNPCVTGDTLVAVADGRNSVPIRDLVGTEYPVYAIENGNTVIKKSIKTWKTRENAEIWELILDDNSKLRATPDHQIMLRDGTYKAMKDLLHGDSIMPFNSYLSNGHYRQINCNNHRDRRQYRMIAEHNKLIVDAKTTAIHHRDFNSLNDDITNLMAMPHHEHQELHASRMRGINNAVHRIKDRVAWCRKLKENSTGITNPNSWGASNEEIYAHALEATKAKGRNLVVEEWKIYANNNKLPSSFHQYRRQALGTIKEMLVRAAKEIGVPVLRTAHIKPKRIRVLLTLEQYKQRLLDAHEKLKTEKREKQIKVFNDLRLQLSRIPEKKEWVLACKVVGVSAEISRVTSPFKSWKDLKQAASMFNHRVVSVNFVGYEDVYDMTVEDVHNFGIVTSMSDDKAITSSGIFIHNCVEASLRAFSFCNLCEIDASAATDQKHLEDMVEAAAFIGTLQAGFTDFHYLRPIWRETTEEDALLGVSLTGIAGMKEGLDLGAAARVAVSVNEYYAKEIGIKPAARVTCCKPAGTTSLVMGTSSGVHPWHSEYYIRRIRINKMEPLCSYLMRRIPGLIEDSVYDESDAVISLPVKAVEGAVTRKETALDFLERVKRIQNTWVKGGHCRGENTHNVSATVTVKDGEWQLVSDWMWNNRDCYAGLSILPEDCGTYQQLPFEEISEEKYLELVEKVRGLDLTQVEEAIDNTNLSGELSCAGGACLM